MIIIHSFEEQQFIEKLLFHDNKITNHVWLGARLNNKTHKFHWEDKSDPMTQILTMKIGLPILGNLMEMENMLNLFLKDFIQIING